MATLIIIGKRWFSRGPGNTYFSAKAYADGKCVATFKWHDVRRLAAFSRPGDRVQLRRFRRKPKAGPLMRPHTIPMPRPIDAGPLHVWRGRYDRERTLK